MPTDIFLVFFQVQTLTKKFPGEVKSTEYFLLKPRLLCFTCYICNMYLIVLDLSCFIQIKYILYLWSYVYRVNLSICLQSGNLPCLNKDTLKLLLSVKLVSVFLVVITYCFCMCSSWRVEEKCMKIE